MKKILSIIFALFFLFSCVPTTVFANEASPASESEEVVSTDLSKTTIEYDFKYIFAGKLKLENYLENLLNKDLELISVMESKNSLGERELYLYIFNPSRQNVFKYSRLNTVNISQGSSDDYFKQELVFINSTSDTSNSSEHSNALILKYRVKLKSSERIYKIADIEILKEGESLPKHFVAGMQYEFFENSSGYTCCTSQSLSVVETKVFHTFYRFETDSIGEYEDLRSVYFPVPNTYLEMYNGNMAEIQASWEVYDSNNIFITDNLSLKNDVSSVLAKTIPSSFKYSILYNQAFLSPMYEFLNDAYLEAYNAEALSGFVVNKNPPNLLSNYAFSGKLEWVAAPSVTTSTLTTISHSLYVKDTQTVGKMVAYNKLEAYYKDKCYLGSPYTRYKGSYNKTFTFGQTFTSIPQYARCSWWESLTHDFTYYNKLDESQQNEFYNFIKIDKSDILNLSNDELSLKYLIHEVDVEDFKKNITSAEYSDCTWFILRYDVTDYKEVNAIAVNNESGKIVGNSLMANLDIIFNFDLIKVVFGVPGKPDTYGVYPIGNSPTMSVVAIFVPEKPSVGIDDLANVLKDKFNKLWNIIAKVLAVIAVFLLLSIVIKIFGLFRRRKIVKKYYYREEKKK